MNRELEVHMTLGAEVIRVGRLWARSRAQRETASFEYDPSWIAHPRAFSLDPELPLGPAPFHTERPIFNAFSDPAPDRWGQMLMRRNERVRALAERRAVRTLATIDLLTLVDDETRMGGLRFREPGTTTFLTSTGRRVPPVVELPRLLRATARVIAEEETAEDLALLLAPGTSLGGARPKASVLDRGRLAIAKFPSRDDDWPTTRWEATTIAMARAAGIDVPDVRLELVLKKPVMISARFDRAAAGRIPYMSALTALGARDGELRSYLEIVDAIRSSGAEPSRDLEELWRRLVFNVLVSNVDDHLRNHGFLWSARGWRLAPAFDLNPVPADVRPRAHALLIDEHDAAAPIARILELAELFRLRAPRARQIVREIAAVTRRWRTFARDHEIAKRDRERMASAFEHDDATAARAA